MSIASSPSPKAPHTTSDEETEAAAKEEIHKMSVLLGKAIRARRLEKEMTQLDLATYAELDPNFIGFVERAERRVTLYNAWRIAGGLGISLAELVAPLPTRKVRVVKKPARRS